MRMRKWLSLGLAVILCCAMLPGTIAFGDAPQDETQFTVRTSFNLSKLEPDAVLTADVQITNHRDTAQSVLAIMALYDAQGTMVNVDYQSEEIGAKQTEVVPVEFKLPADADDRTHRVKVFVWDGTRLEDTDGMPFAKATEFKSGETEANHRVKLNFNADWKFWKADREGAYEPGFDDSEWTTVSTPHTYNDIDTFDNFTEGGNNGERSMYTGKTWYRKHFKLDESDAGRKVFIEFEAARQAADVYINGVKLAGKNENGFIPFGYDLTPYLNYGDRENVLAVMVDNTFPYMAEGTDDVLSWHDSHWHPTHGGLYRNVFLHMTDKLHITLPLYSFLETQGTYIYTDNLTKESADVTVEAEVQNEYDADKAVEYVVEIIDRDDRTVLTMKDEKIIGAGEKYIFSTTGTMASPHRWSPEYPYLYRVLTTLNVDGAAVDTYETPLGIRDFEFDNNSGFWINGNNVKLQGWGQKPTSEWAGLGAAYPDWMHDFVLKLMKDAGGNFIRWGHSAGSPTQVKVADKYGLITLQPGVDGEGSTVGGVYSETAYRVRADAFRDMLIYYRNSPSILIWEAGNQSLPDKEARTLKELAKTWDPSGGRSFATRRSDNTMAKYIDLSIGTEGSWELRNNGLPVVEGEYNREEAARRVWDRYTPGYENYKTSPGSSYNLTAEQFAANQAKEYAKISAPEHSGGGNWIFSDSTSHGRVFSEVARVSGEVDAVMLPKEAYFAISAIYRDDPQVHIIGHWNYPAGTKKPVYVMSNADQVELFVNGKSLGKGTKSYNYLFTFNNVQWEAGTIKAVAYDKNGNRIAEQQITTTGAPAKVKLTPITGPSGFIADGADVLLVDAEVVDAAGNRVLTFDGRIDFEMAGPGIWRGGYNSGKEHSTNNTYLDIEAGINRVAIRSTLKPGTITLEGTVAGLEADTIEVELQPVAIKDGLSAVMPQIPAQQLEGSEPPIGDGPDRGPEGPDPIEPELIANFSYSGKIYGAKVVANTKNGDLSYVDRAYTFSGLPIELLGGEYVLAGNDDKNYVALDMMNFSVEKDAYIYVAHDDRVPRPGWLTSQFTDTGENILINNKDVHSLFVREAAAGESLTLGGNLDKSSSGSSFNMYVVFAKEKSKRDALIREDFEAMEVGQPPAGWTVKTGANTSALVKAAPDGNGKSLNLYDTNVSDGDNMVLVSKGFSVQNEEVVAEWRLMDKRPVNGNWVRMLLLDGAPLANPLDKSNFAVELYVSGGNLIYKNPSDGNVTIQPIAANTWYSVKVIANASSGKFDVYVDGVKKVTGAALRNSSISGIDHLAFGSGTKYTTDFYLDDIEVKPGAALGPAAAQSQRLRLPDVGLPAGGKEKVVKTLSAAGEANVEVHDITVDPSGSSVEIAGAISTGGGQEVTIIIMRPDGTLEYLNQTTSGEEGKFAFAYRPAAMTEGQYQLRIGGEGVQNPYTGSFEAEPARTPQAALSGPAVVAAGDEVTLLYGLENVRQEVYAQDLTVTYDADKLEFLAAETLDKTRFEMVKTAESEGNIRVLSVHFGEAQSRPNGDLMKLSFRAKPGIQAGSVTVSVDGIIIADGEGTETALAGTSHRIQIRDVIGIPGDFNGDGKVSVGDLAIIAAHYGKDSTSADWNDIRHLDTNGDKKIDIVDLVFIARLMLE